MFQQENQKYSGMNTTAGDVVPVHNESVQEGRCGRIGTKKELVPY